MLHQLSDLGLALHREERLRCPLDRVAHPVELGRVPTCPQSVQRHPLSICSRTGELLRDHDEGATGPGKPTILGEGPEFDRALARSLDLVNRARQPGVLDVGLVSRVIKNDGIVRARIVDPLLQLLPGRHRPGRVIRIAQVDEIHLFLRKGRGKIILSRAGQVDQPCKLSPFVALSSVACHHIGIHVNRVDRIGNRNLLPTSEDIEDVARVTF